MKKLKRMSLSFHAIRFLQNRSDKVEKDVTQASRLWKMRRNKAFDEIRFLLSKMATGLQTCMYCETNEATDIEHFWPRSLYPHRVFDWLNYLLACTNCNSNHKRDRFPLDAQGLPLLIDPTVDDPLEHLEFLPRYGSYMGITEKGRQSVEVFGLERETLRRSRRNAWVALQGLIVLYAACRSRERLPQAEDIRRTVCEYPFSSVLCRLLDLAARPSAYALMDEDCLGALRRYPEIHNWTRDPT